ncbi:hypothetical protein BU24DRAFT_448223 [Aaosphaeria arxii CBS 175.79]|uniref:Ubiquitin-like domain-containing protein n=1 Tax=Aaosphaeria arxii CBS 175.79 TaxID=1450172 RepID=A0A6A5Y3H7_9PLEO|nr:uncharacterized protein BU24DRAFT_448223 [Aaosphaeria arxii CBS 175.79]KAF2019816.1 hypothetical protein BU24DRAFT_448223 [Aaosphaeria arxii CBS 175.79]
MSVGISVIEIFKSGHFLYKVVRLLRKEATEEYNNYAERLRWFAALASTLNNLVDSGQLTGNHLLFKTQKNIKKLVKKCCSQMRTFEPNLGPKREKRSITNAFRKVIWTFRRDDLETLLSNLEKRLEPIQSQIMQLAPSNLQQAFPPQVIASSSLPPPPDKRFLVEDAFRRTYSLSFGYIDTWEHCHEFLLRLYPKDDQYCDMIATSSYMFFNASSNKLIVPSGPCIESFQTLVKAGECIEMSMIFPYEESRTCSACVSVYEPSAVGPDILTQISLENINEADPRAFLEDFLTEMESMMDNSSGESDSNKSKEESAPTSERRDPPSSEIKHFRRVTLCSPQWPDLSRCKAYSYARERLGNIVTQLDQDSKLIQKSPELPSCILAYKLGFKVGDWTILNLKRSFYELISAQYKLQSRRNRQMGKLILRIYYYIHQTQQAGFPLHSYFINVRCQAWMISRLIALEERMLLKCSETLYAFSPKDSSNRLKRPEPSLLEKIVDCRKIPDVLQFGLYNMVYDSLCEIRNPAVKVILRGVLGPSLSSAFSAEATIFSKAEATIFSKAEAIFQLLRDSSGLSFEYYFAKSLQNYNLHLTQIPNAQPKSQEHTTTLESSCLSCLESAMRSEGQSLEVRSI